jgi:hypothetical protein
MTAAFTKAPNIPLEVILETTSCLEELTWPNLSFAPEMHTTSLLIISILAMLAKSSASSRDLRYLKTRF